MKYPKRKAHHTDGDRVFILSMFGLCLFMIAVLCLTESGCITTPAPETVQASTGRVLTPYELRINTGFLGATTPAPSYAEVNSKFLQQYYNDFSNELFHLGITGWSTEFECVSFASFYADYAKTRYYLQNYASKTSPATLALGVIWYKPDNAIMGHAIDVAWTERGIIYIEPQTGRWLTLSATEIHSIYRPTPIF